MNLYIFVNLPPPYPKEVIKICMSLVIGFGLVLIKDYEIILYSDFIFSAK